MPNWLITGGCGFIGSALTSKLLCNNENNIRILDNLSVGSPDGISQFTNFEQKNCKFNQWDGVQLVVGDILDTTIVNKSAKNADFVVHLAANTGVQPSIIDPHSDCNTNVVGTLNVLEACKENNVTRFIFASSGAPLGAQNPPLHEKLVPKPLSPYGASKLAGEGYASAYWYSYNLSSVVLRFGNVYGTGSHQKNSVVAKFIKNQLDGKKIEVFGDGKQTRDYIFIDDLVEAILLSATTADLGHEVFQIATSYETNIIELVNILRKAFKERGIKFNDVIHTNELAGDAKRNFSDTSKAAHILGWTSKTSLTSGIDKTLDYFLSNYEVL